jgi:methyl-accepting chemotaxis protein
MRRLFASIQIWQKLLMLGAISLVLCAVPTVLYIIAAQKEIAETRNEIRGLAPARAALNVVRELQTHRAQAAATLSGNQTIAKARTETEKRVNESLAALYAALPTKSESITKAAEKADAEWKSLIKSVSDKSYSMDDSHNRHSRLVTAYLRILETIASHYGLDVDPDTDTHSTIVAALGEMPAVTEAISKINSLGTTMLNLKQASAEERVNITSMLERSRERLENAIVNYQRGFDNNAALKAALDPSMAAMQTQTQNFIAVTDLEFVRIEVLRHDPVEYAKRAQQALDAQYALIEASFKQTGEFLDARAKNRTLRMAALLGLIAALVILAAILTFVIMRSINQPIRAAIKDAEAIAAGRLDSEIDDIGLDEVGRLRRAMQLMQENLRHIVHDIRASSEGMAAAAHQIAASTRDMSSRTEEQASSLEQTAASMEEMNSSVQENDQAGQHANDLAANAAQAAERGGEVVGKVARTMQEIDTSSKKIAEIISVIDGIAFQTNILALNAAVEAARAGDQGRGFAVVASEVRALAQRSGQASKEIRVLIAESVKKVQSGTREAVASGKAMEEILSMAKQVADTMAQIKSASQDQRQGIAQVSRAVEQMNNGTQQSAAMVAEVAATADSLDERANQLLDTVSAFKIAGDAAAAADMRAREPASAAQHNTVTPNAQAASRLLAGSAPRAMLPKR